MSQVEAVGAKYVVLEEATLGYLVAGTKRDGIQMMGVLHGSVLKGGHDWKNGAVMVVDGVSKFRPATEADFDEYRVRLPRDFSTQKLEEVASLRH